MKKLISLLLVLVMAMSVLAGCAETPAQTEATEPSTEATEAVVVPESALEIMENTWADFPEDKKFPVGGGDMVTNTSFEGPALFDLKEVDGLTYQLQVPADQVANLDDAATMIHGMLLNNFASGALHVTGDVDAFVETMHEAIANAQWMCGFPEKMLIAVVGGEYVVVAYGLNDNVNPFETALTEAYPDTVVKYSEAIG